jgi:hemerythrin-like domain-containing protein
MSMDALTLVRQDHQQLEELLVRCERLEGVDKGERAVLLGQVRAALRHHVDQEESILYMIYRERARRAGVDLAPLDHAIEQHRLIDRLAGQLTDDAAGDTLAARLTVLIERVRTHMDDEASELLTAIEDLVEDDTLMELGRRMEQRDRVIEARRELATMVPGGARGRRVAAFGGLAALAAAVLAFVTRRRRPPASPTRRRRPRRR